MNTITKTRINEVNFSPLATDLKLYVHVRELLIHLLKAVLQMAICRNRACVLHSLRWAKNTESDKQN